jgi:hypothetical protein
MKIQTHDVFEKIARASIRRRVMMIMGEEDDKVGREILREHQFQHEVLGGLNAIQLFS